ncbi:MAG: hypothetical protein OEZ08_03430 [Betaproteobacteria bacterium]|nr:hypothetical protein [Betaproteobacteria bacterium]
MMATLTLYDPTAPGRDMGGDANAARTALGGAVVGFIDNAKPNFNHLVDDLAEVLIRKYKVARVVKRRKTSASIPAKPEVVEGLSAECDVVIAGSGD